jgi:hypothetical protein
MNWLFAPEVILTAIWDMNSNQLSLLIHCPTDGIASGLKIYKLSVEIFFYSSYKY